MKGFDLVKEKGLKDIIAIKTKDKFYDLSSNIDEEDIEFIEKNSQIGLDIIRHSSSHLLALAVQTLFPDALFTIGPSIENGFYYDIDKSVPFIESDLLKIETKMNEFIKDDVKFIREEISKQDALNLFTENKYKIEIINELPDNEVITIYRLGSFIDLCRGVHVPSTRYLKFFKLTKVAGAYWRGDSKNKMLQRIYGTAWTTKEDLDGYFKFIEEAEKRDHKKICKAMDLCHFESDYAPGAPFYHPNGWFVFRTLVEFLRKKKTEAGYIEVATPRVMNRALWETSGHWEKYGEHNYSGEMEDKTQFCVKPMNCPGGILIYNQGIKSYRDLPIRMAEFGQVNRYEASGSLNGLLRVREFTQDDAHVFCTLEQTENEISDAITLFMEIYNILGFDKNSSVIGLSTRPNKRIGSEEVWDKSEKFLADTLNKLNISFDLQEGAGAFYGPKLEFGFKDALGRSWQIGTIQLDMNLPSRFDMTYVGEDGQKHEPVMLHMALFGSIERFLGMYIEHTEGKFPLWFNPLHAAILNINENVIDYCSALQAQFKNENLRSILDISAETLNYKIRDYSLRKVPYLIIIGDKEKQNKTITVRTFGTEKQFTLKIEDFISKIKEKIEKKEIGFDL
ncbi:MAG: threonine--tRNA ligase [Rickettsiales bacterium]|jgi:threonyl-tRNA synthetase|nr:threonine--tRNA ligase [Rickettsiales bacterium]